MKKNKIFYLIPFITGCLIGKKIFNIDKKVEQIKEQINKFSINIDNLNNSLIQKKDPFKRFNKSLFTNRSGFNRISENNSFNSLRGHMDMSINKNNQSASKMFQQKNTIENLGTIDGIKSKVKSKIKDKLFKIINLLD